jgi:hypothetical protein
MLESLSLPHHTSQESTNSPAPFWNVAYFQIQVRNKYYIIEEKESCVLGTGLL